MSGQVLGHFRARPATHDVRHIRVPQVVKVHDAAGGVGGLQEVGPFALGFSLGVPAAKARIRFKALQARLEFKRLRPPRATVLLRLYRLDFSYRNGPPAWV